MRILLWLIMMLSGTAGVRASLLPGPETCLLRYLQFREYYCLLAVSDRSAQLYTLPDKKTIDSLAARYLQSIRQRKADRFCGYQLYRALLPIDWKSYRRLVISTDGQLGRIPFECLPLDSSGTAPYLLEACAIQYSLHPTGWIKSPGNQRHRPAKRLALAPEYRNSGMATLPFAAREITATHPGFQETLCPERLSKQQFFELAPDFDWLHLGTHGHSDTANPDNSCFYLSRTDSVSAREIRGLQLDAQLLILSACHSANGMADAFAHAGAKNILASLWELPDKCCTGIVRSFYHYLRRGNDKARALQLAKLDYLRKADAEGAEPYYWSGLVLYGDQTAISLYKPAYKLALWLDVALCLLAALLFYLRKKYIPEGLIRDG